MWASEWSKIFTRPIYESKTTFFVPINSIANLFSGYFFSQIGRSFGPFHRNEYQLILRN